MKFTKPNKLLIISAVLGVAMTVAGGYSFMSQLNTANKTVEVVVPKKDIPKYHLVTASDLTFRTIPADSLEPGAVVEPSGIVGKVAADPLYTGEQIDGRRLTQQDIFKGYDLLCVNVDLARSGGAIPGNTVDVYKLVQDTQSGTVTKMPAAKDAIVMNVWDGQGNDLYNSKDQGLANIADKALSVSSTKPPAVIRLAVKPSDSGNIIDGSINGKTYIALAVKSKTTGGVKQTNGEINQSEEITEQPKE